MIQFSPKDMVKRGGKTKGRFLVVTFENGQRKDLRKIVEDKHTDRIHP